MQPTAADTSSMIAFLQGDKGEDVLLIHLLLQHQRLLLPAPVLSELLSDPVLNKKTSDALQALPILGIKEGYWQRVGKLRAGILAQKKKARLADALIAQNCLDYQFALVTRDKDFRHFAIYAGLHILP